MWRALAGPVFIAAGLLHFIKPGFYGAIMPEWLPAHTELVYASGVAEIAGGIALLAPDRKVRRYGMWWLIATLVAVFPANLHMALTPDDYESIPPWALWARLPLQAGFIAWVAAAGRRD